MSSAKGASGQEGTAGGSAPRTLMGDPACTPAAKYTITTAKTPLPVWVKTPISPVHGVPHPHPTVTASVPAGPAARRTPRRAAPAQQPRALIDGPFGGRARCSNALLVLILS